METPLTNPDRRSLPPGWVTQFDSRRKIWYYINLEAATPQVSFIHPDDQDLPFERPRGRSVTMPAGSIPHQQPMATTAQSSTPFATAMQASKAKKPTFAQQLYASATWSVQRNSEENEQNSSVSEIVTQSTSPEEDRSLSPAPALSLNPPTSSSGPLLSFTSSTGLQDQAPQYISRGPTRRPRGARKPTFLRPSTSLPSTSAYPGFAVPFANGNADDLGGRVLLNLSSSNGMPMPQEEIRFRQHRRTATVPSTAPNTASQSFMSKSKETPTYSLISRPPEASSNCKMTTPAFQALPHTTLRSVSTPNAPPFSCPIVSPIQPALAILGSPLLAHVPLTSPSMSNLPSGAAAPMLPMQYFLPASQTVINTQSPTLTCSPNRVGQNPDSNNHDHKVLKKVGIAAGKSAGKTAIRVGAKMVLGSIGVPTNLFPSSDSSGDVMDTLAAGMSQLAVSAGSSAVLNPSPTLVNPPPNTASSTVHSVTPVDYAAILNQMQTRQPAQQQSTPQQSSLNPSDVSLILAQMQAMHLSQQQQPAQMPSGNNSGSYCVQPPVLSQGATQWRQSLSIGGATNELCTGAISNFNFAAPTDSTFDLNSSFDPYA
ncbi:hypothetical protein GALMADRAFT_233941 [Galerina marginata CBS 339.88]|uniref:WW domain-containing protein n=1 Tax=Galerina marginata (strain CBS 339.88) TaxID=685588 RepID=A0A067TPV6_GALM3|nr:hypothetical protein GALMADRAFT_233941 [Galerina marginata CBS 339.88]